MDFLLSKEQKIIQKAAREFARGELAPMGRELDLNETYPDEIVKKARELGLIGLFVPEKFGGPGLG
ncbi:MAG: acyl-CoA dehydrogenase family protein, partial [Desulfotignum sp.]